LKRNRLTPSDTELAGELAHFGIAHNRAAALGGRRTEDSGHPQGLTGTYVMNGVALFRAFMLLSR
jgi:hypothetical protein